MHVKITNGTVDTYPYNVGQLRRDNPYTSFPKQIPEEMLKEYGVFPVSYTDAPSIDQRTQKLEQEAQPSLVNGVWTVGWTVIDKAQEEVRQYDEDAAANVRSQRDSLLAVSDWTQVPDAPVNKTAWAVYRQALRDITNQVRFPHEVVWPVKPE